MGKPPYGNIDIMVKEAAKIKGKNDFFTWDRKGRKQEREVDNGNEASKLITRIESCS
jgi:hypothetical protein